MSHASELFQQTGTASDQLIPYSELAAQTSELVTDAALLSDEANDTSGRIHELHTDALGQALTVLALNLEQEPLPDLLNELTQQFAFSWATMARCLRLSPTAIRKWRRGDDASRENRQRVATLLAFSRFLQKTDPRVVDAGDWLEGTISKESSLTRADLYSRGAAIDLLLMARSVVRPGPDNVLPEQVLDRHLGTSWRAQHGDDDRFTVEWDEQGDPSIVLRRDDE